MQDLTAALDTYLTNRFGTRLEQMLSDALAGVSDAPWAKAVQIACDPLDAFAYEDGGFSEQYQGMLQIEGLTYRVVFSVFVDAGGARFIESIGTIQLLRWNVRVAIPARTAAIA